MDPLFLAELNERLFVHFIAGRWMAPLSDRLAEVLPFDRGRMGRLACAGEADVARALAGLRPGRAEGLAQAYAEAAPMLRRLRALEGVADPVDAPGAAVLPGQGPLILLSAADTPLAQLAALLIAGAERGVIWKPAPRAAASAHLMMRALGPRAAGGLALLQGDHASGRALAGQGALLWASTAPCPFSQPAGGQPRP